MKKLRFIKEYQQFRENFGEEGMNDVFNDDQVSDVEQGESPESQEEVTESGCQDALSDAIDNLDAALQGCMGVESEESEEEYSEMENESLEEETETEENESPEGHDEREMEIYGRMKELSDELKGLMAELRGEESHEEHEEGQGEVQEEGQDDDEFEDKDE